MKTDWTHFYNLGFQIELLSLRFSEIFLAEIVCHYNMLEIVHCVSIFETHATGEIISNVFRVILYNSFLFLILSSVIIVIVIVIVVDISP
jgi:hypothetical protein